MLGNHDEDPGYHQCAKDKASGYNITTRNDVTMIITFQSYLGNEVTGGIVAWLGSGIFGPQ